MLLLSEFAGAASFMREGSISFHPANRRELSNAIYRAVTMGPQEKEANYRKLRAFIDDHTSAKWGESFIERLSQRLQ